MRGVLFAALVATGCRQPPVATDSPGAQLEAAAVAQRLVADPGKVGLAGTWGSDTDRLCVVPAGESLQIGAAIDYGDGQTCAGTGTMERAGQRLRVRLGACRFDATFDGERITFPAELPGACTRLCTGRASVSALSVERLSESTSEAAMLRGPNGRTLCSSG